MSHTVVAGSPDLFWGLDAFLRRLEARAAFDRGAELFIARAPGRLDVMGGIADYSGSHVLQLPIRESTFVALERSAGREVRVESWHADGGPTELHEEREERVTVPLAWFEGDGRPLEYADAAARFRARPGRRWAAYVAGAFGVLMRERSVRFATGARIVVCSDVPEGKGVASSAALEVAAMQAVCAAYGVRLAQAEIAALCQTVENRVAGAPCGIMDQMTAAVGHADQLLSLRCQPATLCGHLPVPPEVALFGLDSGVRHAVGGADYGAVRAATSMGYRICAELAGLRVAAGAAPGRVRIDDPAWGGYLANMSPAEFEGRFAAALPRRLRGDAFLRAHGGITDPVAAVDPARVYAVRSATAHPVYENARVDAFARSIGRPVDEPRLRRLGALMLRSHRSYSACGLGSPATDLLVALVRAAGPARGLYGARITGGGCGGTVAVLGRRGRAEAAVEQVAAAYRERTGHQPFVFSRSSPGAAASGTLRVVFGQAPGS